MIMMLISLYMILIYVYIYIYDFLNHDLRWLESIDHKLDAWNTHDSKHRHKSEVKVSSVTEAFNSTQASVFPIGGVPPSHFHSHFSYLDFGNSEDSRL